MARLKYLSDVATLDYNKELCTGCGLCAIVCPHRVFQMSNKRAEIVDRDRCMECGACEINCAYDAIQVKKGVGCATAVLYSYFNKGEVACGPSCGPSCCD